MMLKRLHGLIDTAESEPATFPLTLIFNEGWLLRLILDWYARHPITDHPLLFHENATWFSEAQLPTPFRSRYRGDIRAEARTHADGVVGHFSIGNAAKADLTLNPNATQLIVLEAKISSYLSSGTRNAPLFNQAARSVACIAELLCRESLPPERMTSLAFFVVAPEEQINKGIFASQLDKPAIWKAVQDRAGAFSLDLSEWLDKWFMPTFIAIQIDALSWESLIETIATKDVKAFKSLQEFYNRCLMYK